MLSSGPHIMEQRKAFAKRAALPLILAACALSVRILFAASFLASPLAQPFEGGHDRALYHAAAQAPPWPDGAFEYLPLYPWALHLVYTVAGPRLGAAAGFGIACDTLTTLLIFLIARRMGIGRGWAAAAALVFAAYPLAIVYSCLTMPNSLNAMLLAAVLFGALCLPAGAWPAWAGLGLLAGISAWGWAAWLIIAPALAAYWLLARSPTGPRYASIAAFALAFPLPLLPVALHNSRAEGAFVLLTTHGGFNLFMGNHEHATGHPIRVRDFRMTARDLLEDAHRAAERETGRQLKRSESSAWWSAQARAYWRAQPAAAARLLLRKLRLFWSALEMDDLRMVEQVRLLTGWFTRGAWPPYGLMACAGLLGLGMARGAGAVRVVLLAGMCGLVLYFITARYRLALAPALLALGAGGADALFAARREKRRLLLGAGLAALAGLVVFGPVPVRDVRAVDYYNAALQLLKAGRVEEGRELAGRGLALDPAYAPLYHARGTAHFRAGRFMEAASDFAACAGRDPAHPQAAYNLGLSLARAGRPCAARDALARAADVRPLPPAAEALLVELELICDGAGNQ